jgi:hypothetical protein
MTDEELDEIFTALSDLLSDLGLSWLVSQVNDEIQVGQIVTRTFRRGQPEQIERLDIGTKPGSGTVVGTDPYGAADRVDLLVSAVSVALTDTASLEQEVIRFFLSDAAAPKARFITSVPDREVPGETAHVIAGGDDSASTAAQRALPLLEELRHRTARL